MSITPEKKVKADYPPLNDNIGVNDQIDNNEEDERLKADLEDKQPAGDAGPEDALPPKPKKPETKY